MSIHFDHTIVGVRDKHATATYLSELLGLPPAVPYGPFLMHSFGNGAHVHFADSQAAPTSTHLAFRAGEDDFAAVLDRLGQRGIPHWADPFKREPAALYIDGTDRGFYWDDPDGHVLELITRPATTRVGSRVRSGS